MLYNLKPFNNKNMIKKLSSAAIILAFISCTKESKNLSNDIQNEEYTLPIEALQQDNFDYNEVITITANNKNDYVIYQVSSNNKEVVSEMINSLKNAKLEILDQSDRPVNQSENMANISEDEEHMISPYDFNNGVYLKELERHTYNNSPYSITFEPISTKKATTLQSYYQITVTCSTCSSIWIKNLWTHPNYNYHAYYLGSDWQADFESFPRTLDPFAEWAFTNGGYTGHKVISNPSYVNGNFPINNVISYEVW